MIVIIERFIIWIETNFRWLLMMAMVVGEFSSWSFLLLREKYYEWKEANENDNNPDKADNS